MQDTRAPQVGPFRALLERIIAGEGGTYAADDAAGLSHGTFSRWTTRPPKRPKTEHLATLARNLGGRYHFSYADLLEWTGQGPSIEDAYAPLERFRRSGAIPDQAVAVERPVALHRLHALARDLADELDRLAREGLIPASPDDQRRG